VAKGHVEPTAPSLPDGELVDLGLEGLRPMKKKAAYAWAAAGVIIPAVILADLNFFGGALSNSYRLILVVWPSSFMLSGFNVVNLAAIVPLVISVSRNVILYLAVGLISSKIFMLLRCR
jgi:hypothetical protein